MECLNIHNLMVVGLWVEAIGIWGLVTVFGIMAVFQRKKERPHG